MTDKEIEAEIFKGLLPFTITINRPDDARFLCEGFLWAMSKGDKQWALSSLRLLLDRSLQFSPDEIVPMFFDEGRKMGHIVPAFAGPVFIHIIKHLIKRVREMERKQR